ncbi:Fe-S cluster assembly protein SufD [Hyphococcus sp. DH-69]|uniref:Fe-S cluster assembly protein SufD n=1 Tax=Hyphococcus formosus TaxID=3143534 RepID=UPI00398A8F20
MAQTSVDNKTTLETALEASFRGRSSVNEAQAAAFERFEKSRFPNRRVEGWKWSDFATRLRNFSPARESSALTTIEPSRFASLNPLEFRLCDGRIELPQEDMPEGLRYGILDAVATIAELENNPIANLNVAMTRKALGIEIGEGVDFKRPILIRHINSGSGFAFAQTMMRISVNAKVQIIETYEGEATGLYSHLFHLVVRDGASFNRAMMQDTSQEATIHAICAAKIEGDAAFNQSALSTGGQLCRHETHVHFWSPNSRAKINSASLLSGDRHADFTSETRHLAPDCETTQLHKGVARDRARNVFQGKFFVKREAQKTDAKMTANALLLSDTAEANHKPELEIYADDVECAHGSTVGALDQDALFYLRQRGLSEEEARALLVDAFVGEVIGDIDHEQIREIFETQVQNWLAQS